MEPMTTHRRHIALNAHLLSGEASYRSAGIHGYIYNTLAHLPDAAPHADFTVYVGAGAPPAHDWTVCRTTLPTRKPLVRIFWEQFVAPLKLARARPDLLHGMAFALPLAWAGPSVLTIYDLSFLHYPDRLSAFRRWYLTTITTLSTLRATRIIAISESTKADVTILLDVSPDRVDVAYPGVSAAFSPHPPAEVAAFRRREQLPDRFIMVLGTLEPRKNLALLLRAYARLPERNTVKLVLAGGMGWGADPLLALIEDLSLTADVILPGYIPDETLPLWYNAAELFAYPSLYEGFGMPLIEAMACGCPVIASHTSSLPEAVGTAGELLPPDDVEAWAATLTRLLADPVRRAEMAERGRAQAHRFTWQRTAQQTAHTYRRALEGHDQST